MSSEVTIGKQNSGITKTTRAVSLKDMPPRLRERLKREEQAEAAPMVAASTTSPIEAQLEWFRAYRYGLYDVAKDEDEAFSHLDQYIALKKQSGEEWINIYKALLHSFSKGTENIQPDSVAINYVVDTLYRKTDIFDDEKNDFLLNLLQNEGIENSYTESIETIKRKINPIHSSMQFWFFKDPFYPNWLVYFINPVAFLCLFIVGILSIFNGWKIIGFVSKYAVMLAWILLPLNFISLYWRHRKNSLYEQFSSVFPLIQPHSKLSSLKEELDKRFRISNSGNKTELHNSIAAIVVCGLLLYLGIPNAERYEQNIVVEDDMEKQAITSYESALNFSAPTSAIEFLKQEGDDNEDNASSVPQSPRKEAIKTLGTFNGGIASHNPKLSYDYIFQDTQAQMEFEGWGEKFIPVIDHKCKSADIQVIEEHPDRVVLNYKVSPQLKPKEYYYTFEVKMEFVKTTQGWKIYSSSCKYIY